eukprot:SAG22_NODE_144_length_17700_cov_21.959207_8_plen_343_part_00
MVWRVGAVSLFCRRLASLLHLLDSWVAQPAIIPLLANLPVHTTSIVSVVVWRRVLDVYEGFSEYLQTFLRNLYRHGPMVPKLEVGFWNLPLAFDFDATQLDLEVPSHPGRDMHAQVREKLCDDLSLAVGHGSNHLREVFKHNTACMQVFKSKTDDFVLMTTPACMCLLAYLLVFKLLWPLAKDSALTAESGVLKLGKTLWTGDPPGGDGDGPVGGLAGPARDLRAGRAGDGRAPGADVGRLGPRARAGHQQRPDRRGGQLAAPGVRDHLRGVLCRVDPAAPCRWLTAVAAAAAATRESRLRALMPHPRQERGDRVLAVLQLQLYAWRADDGNDGERRKERRN